MFEPPRCPYESCPRHRAPGTRFFLRHGFYRARVHTDPVPRFRCRSCRRTFSRQTFRVSYRDKKPHLNNTVFDRLTGGDWFNKSGRRCHLTRKNMMAKARKLQRHLRHFNRNVLRRGPLPADDLADPIGIQFDEYETYEARRNTRPLTVATAIHVPSQFVISMVVAPIRPHGIIRGARKRAIEADERRFGPRKHLSKLACRLSLGRAATFRPDAREITLATDEKRTYPLVAAQAFHGRRWSHATTNSRRPRGAGTPLFPINLAERKIRTHNSRTQREMPNASKKRKYLSLHLEMHIAFRNWVRPRFLYDEASPAQIAGYATRRLEMGELLGWRQDWGLESPCVTGHGLRTVGEMPRREVA